MTSPPLTANEVRQNLGLSPVDGGDDVMAVINTPVENGRPIDTIWEVIWCNHCLTGPSRDILARLIGPLSPTPRVPCVRCRRRETEGGRLSLCGPSPFGRLSLEVK